MSNPSHTDLCSYIPTLGVCLNYRRGGCGGEDEEIQVYAHTVNRPPYFEGSNNGGEFLLCQIEYKCGYKIEAFWMPLTIYV